MDDKDKIILRAVSVATIMLVVSGTSFYHYFEKWSILDSFYFCMITLTTVGYGDLSPTTPVTKLFTVAYIIMGIGIIATFINLSAKARLNKRVEKKIKTKD